jgi:hypothetical protein
MGRKKVKEINPPAVPAKSTRGAVGRPVSIKPVTLIDTAQEVAALEGLPEEWEKGETLAGFPPSPEWREPGEAIWGEFIGLRTDVGPNKSRIYEIAAYQGDHQPPVTVAVWGSAALDRLFDSAYPPIQMGDRVGIVYLGEKPTQRGLNPVKLFALRVLRAKR